MIPIVIAPSLPLVADSPAPTPKAALGFAAVLEGLASDVSPRAADAPAEFADATTPTKPSRPSAQAGRAKRASSDSRDDERPAGPENPCSNAFAYETSAIPAVALLAAALPPPPSPPPTEPAVIPAGSASVALPAPARSAARSPAPVAEGPSSDLPAPASLEPPIALPVALAPAAKPTLVAPDAERIAQRLAHVHAEAPPRDAKRAATASAEVTPRPTISARDLRSPSPSRDVQPAAPARDVSAPSDVQPPSATRDLKSPSPSRDLQSPSPPREDPPPGAARDDRPRDRARDVDSPAMPVAQLEQAPAPPIAAPPAASPPRVASAPVAPPSDNRLAPGDGGERQRAVTSAIHQMTVRHGAAEGRVEVPSLGAVHVEARQVAGAVSVDVRAERPATAQTLQHATPALLASAREDNVPVWKLEVKHDATRFDSRGGAGSRDARERPPEQRDREPSDDALTPPPRKTRARFVL